MARDLYVDHLHTVRKVGLVNADYSFEDSIISPDFFPVIEALDDKNVTALNASLSSLKEKLGDGLFSDVIKSPIAELFCSKIIQCTGAPEVFYQYSGKLLFNVAAYSLSMQPENAIRTNPEYQKLCNTLERFDPGPPLWSLTEEISDKDNRSLDLRVLKRWEEIAPLGEDIFEGRMDHVPHFVVGYHVRQSFPSIGTNFKRAFNKASQALINAISRK